jgi:hypothetical protein
MEATYLPFNTLICTLACRSSSSRAEDSALSEGRVLFDLVLTLAAGAGTWFDLTSGRYRIAIHLLLPESQVRVMPVSAGPSDSPAACRSDKDGRGFGSFSEEDIVNLPQQTRLSIKNPETSGRAETVAVRIVKIAV